MKIGTLVPINPLKYLGLVGGLLSCALTGWSQVGLLTLSSGIDNGGSISLPLSLLPVLGSEPAAVQWTLTYPPANVALASVTPGPAASGAGKTISCMPGTGTLTCVAYGMNTTKFGSAVVANVNLTMAAGATTTSIGVSNVLAASNSGNAIMFLGVGGTIIGGGVSLPRVGSVSCAPTSLGNSSSASCGVTLTSAALAGGATIAVTSSQSALAVPATVTVPAGSLSATFNVITSVFSTNQVATVTATYNNSSANSQINLVAPAVGSPSLAQNKIATQSSTGLGAVASRATDGNTDGNFYSGSVTHTDMAANPWWQVDLGSSAAIASIVIWNRTDCCSNRLSDYWVFVSDTPFGPSDTPTTLQSRSGTWARRQTSMPAPSASIAATGAQGRYVRVQLSGMNYLSLAEVQVTGSWVSAPVSLSTRRPATQSSTGLGAVASRATDGNTDGNFYNGSVTHTDMAANPWWQVDLGSSAAIASIVIWNRTDCCSNRLSDYWVFASNTPFAASDTPAGLQNRPGTWSRHAVSIPAPISIIPTTALQARYVRVQLAGVNYLSLAEVQVFGPLASGSTSSLQPSIQSVRTSAASGSSPSGTTVPIAIPTLRELTCIPKPLTGGTQGRCRIRLDHADATRPIEIQLSTSIDSVKVPLRIRTARGQASAEFQIDVHEDSPAGPLVVAAKTAASRVEETLTIISNHSLRVRAPGTQFVEYGAALLFRVSSSDSSARLTALSLPAGADFNSNTGEFHWSPGVTQEGAHKVTFAAARITGETAKATVDIHVDRGSPVVTRFVNAASRSREAVCSPGAMASIEGRWLATGPRVSDLSAASTELGGTKVWVNGTLAILISASSNELTILCPSYPSGAPINVAVQTALGNSALLHTTSRLAAPGIFSVDGSGTGQGWVVLGDGDGVAMVRNYRFASQPATAGDRLMVYATGLKGLTGISARVAESRVAIDGMGPVAERPGLYWIAITLPEGVATGEGISLSVDGEASDGSHVTSNAVRIAVEAANGR